MSLPHSSLVSEEQNNQSKPRREEATGSSEEKETGKSERTLLLSLAFLLSGEKKEKPVLATHKGILCTTICPALQFFCLFFFAHFLSLSTLLFPLFSSLHSSLAMRLCSGCVLLLAWLAWLACCLGEANSRRPNIVVFLVDDLGHYNGEATLLRASSAMIDSRTLLTHQSHCFLVCPGSWVPWKRQRNYATH